MPQRISIGFQASAPLALRVSDQELANSICSVARSALMHAGYDGRKTTAGNIAVPFSPVEVPVGPSYAYSIWHALPVDDPLEPFPTTVETFPRS